MAYKPKIFFRADGNSHIGLGHLIRSLALAEMLKDEFDCYMFIRQPSQAIANYIEVEGVNMIELNDRISLEEEAHHIVNNWLSGKEIMVLDGYHFKTAYQHILKPKTKKLVCIDDIYEFHFVADVIINHLGGVKRTDYIAEPYTQFFLGMKYALLRKPFREAARHQNMGTTDEQIFICLGGADPNNNTLDVLEKVSKSFNKCNLVLGNAYRHRASLDDYLTHKTELEVKVFSNLNAEEMCNLMQRCRVAITPPSSISYEYLSVGGLLYLQKIASNQNKVYEYLVSNQMAYSFNNFASHEKIKINHKTSGSQTFFDGQQAERFRQIFKELSA